jgi:3-oxoacyl-[acyl-carrier protein] reductase
MVKLELKNKIALITGASRGIGRSISIALADASAHVVLAARNKNLLDDVSHFILSNGGKATVVPTDISSKDDVRTLFQKVRDQWGKLDILVNNAGIGIFGKLADFAVADFNRLIDVNLRGTYFCCQEAVGLMIPRGEGYIINISSMQGIKAYPTQSAYAATKHAIMGFTKSLAAEVQEYGIRVSVILPGGDDTDLIREARPDLNQSVLIYPEDVAKTVLYLLSLSNRAMVDQIVVRRSAASPF